jgi:hypothetical protein
MSNDLNDFGFHTSSIKKRAWLFDSRHASWLKIT